MEYILVACRYSQARVCKSGAVRHFGSVVGALFIAVLVACGDSTSTTDGVAFYETTREQLLVSHQKFVEQHQIECEHAELCHPAVGQVLFSSIEDGRITHSVCTGTLAESFDKVITNGHCVPKELWPEGSSCVGQVSIMFPQIGYLKQITVGCKQIELLRQPYPASPIVREQGEIRDVAVFSLESSVTRPFAQVSRSGIGERDQVDLHVFDPPTKRKQPSVYRVRSCVARSQGPLQASLVEWAPPVPFIPKIDIINCKAILGNSGGAIMDARSSSARTPRIRALVWGTLRPETKPLMQARNLSDDDALGVNLACLMDNLNFRVSERVPIECIQFKKSLE